MSNAVIATLPVIASGHLGNPGSIYFRDPNGYVIELTAKRDNHDTVMNPATNGARDKLDRWQTTKSG